MERVPEGTETEHSGVRIAHEEVSPVRQVLRRVWIAAIVLVVEDRWAGPLSAAARDSGGEVLAGERIPRLRVEAALAGLRREGAPERHGPDNDFA